MSKTIEIPDGYKAILVKDTPSVYNDILEKAYHITDKDVKDCKLAIPRQTDLDRIQAYGILLCVSNYLNDGWEPDWADETQMKYHIIYNATNGKYYVGSTNMTNKFPTVFKSERATLQALDMLGDNILDKIYKR